MWLFYKTCNTCHRSDPDLPAPYQVLSWYESVALTWRVVVGPTHTNTNQNSRKAALSISSTNLSHAFGLSFEQICSPARHPDIGSWIYNLDFFSLITFVNVRMWEFSLVRNDRERTDHSYMLDMLLRRRFRKGRFVTMSYTKCTSIATAQCTLGLLYVCTVLLYASFYSISRMLKTLSLFGACVRVRFWRYAERKKTRLDSRKRFGIVRVFVRSVLRYPMATIPETSFLVLECTVT